MLSPFDPIYLVPTYLFVPFSCAESPDLSLALKVEWISKTNYGGFGGNIELCLWLCFGIEARCVWLLSSTKRLVATLSSVSGYVLALRQEASGCIPAQSGNESFISLAKNWSKWKTPQQTLMGKMIATLRRAVSGCMSK
jgi:hypothetical protein